MTQLDACPIWECVPKMDEIDDGGRKCHSPRAGGRFMLRNSALPALQHMNDAQKVRLSYWIHDRNRRSRMPLDLDYRQIQEWSERIPAMEDRLLSFVQELIHQWDNADRLDIAVQDFAGITYDYSQKRDFPAYQNRLLAASGCHTASDIAEFFRHARNLGWIEIHRDSYNVGLHRHLSTLALPARLFVEEHTRDRGQGRQGFVAMWFDPCMDEAYETGFALAIRAAGYEPYRVDRDHYLGKVDDRIIAEIRRSRFVVADFTCATDQVRGSVYYEAGFAEGLATPLFFTCRQDAVPHLCFDTRQQNHLVWCTPQDLKARLQARLEAVLGHGPGTGKSQAGAGTAAAKRAPWPDPGHPDAET